MHLRVEPFRMRNATPMVSFTFDDVPKSAATVGAAILEAHGAHGTFYVIGSQVGTSSPLWDMVDGEDVVALHRHGHEIACHTFSHKRACDLDAATLNAEIERNQQYLRSLDPRSGSRISHIRSAMGRSCANGSSRPSSSPAAASFPASTAAPWTCSSCGRCR